MLAGVLATAHSLSEQIVGVRGILPVLRPRQRRKAAKQKPLLVATVPQTPRTPVWRGFGGGGGEQGSKLLPSIATIVELLSPHCAMLDLASSRASLDNCAMYQIIRAF